MHGKKNTDVNDVLSSAIGTDATLQQAQNGQRSHSQSSINANSSWTFELLPSEFCTIPNCVCWRYEERAGRRTKVPYQPTWGGQLKARAGHPDTWGTFEQAQATMGLYDGLGFNLYPHSTVIQDARWEMTPEGTRKRVPFVRDLTTDEIARYEQNVTDCDGHQLVGIDLDHCIDANGNLADWADDIVQTVSSYTELSPSGTGIRLFAYGMLPPYGRRHGAIEMYTSGRFLTLTGHHVDGTPASIMANPEGVAGVHAKYIDAPRKTRYKRAAKNDGTGGYRAIGDRPWGPQSDQWILYHICKAANATKFEALRRGSIAGYPESQQEPGKSSEADLAFCSIVAYWTADGHQIDRLYRDSGLMRDKWLRDDYRTMTINVALGEVR